MLAPRVEHLLATTAPPPPRPFHKWISSACYVFPRPMPTAWLSQLLLHALSISMPRWPIPSPGFPPACNAKKSHAQPQGWALPVSGRLFYTHTMRSRLCAPCSPRASLSCWSTISPFAHPDPHPRHDPSVAHVVKKAKCEHWWSIAWKNLFRSGILLLK